MKFAWSGFRSLLAFAIIAVTSADPAKSLAAAAVAPCDVGCWASAVEENIAKMTKNRCARMTASCGRHCTGVPVKHHGATTITLRAAPTDPELPEGNCEAGRAASGIQ